MGVGFGWRGILSENDAAKCIVLMGSPRGGRRGGVTVVEDERGLWRPGRPIGDAPARVGDALPTRRVLLKSILLYLYTICRSDEKLERRRCIVGRLLVPTSDAVRSSWRGGMDRSARPLGQLDLCMEAFLVCGMVLSLRATAVLQPAMRCDGQGGGRGRLSSSRRAACDPVPCFVVPCFEIILWWVPHFRLPLAVEVCCFIRLDPSDEPCSPPGQRPYLPGSKYLGCSGGLGLLRGEQQQMPSRRVASTDLDDLLRACHSESDEASNGVHSRASRPWR